MKRGFLAILAVASLAAGSTLARTTAPPPVKMLSQWVPPAGAGYSYAGYVVNVDAMNAWSLATTDNNEVLYTVRKGDVLYNKATGYRDPSTSERSEIAMASNRWANGVAVAISYEFSIPAGFDFNTPWTVIGQQHADLNTPPPLQFAFQNGAGLNQLYAITLAGSPSKPIEVDTKLGSGPLTRDVWHSVAIQTKAGPGGYQRIWFDGAQVVNQSGSIGFTGQTNWYWRMGIYRRATSATYQVRYRNFSMAQQ